MFLLPAQRRRRADGSVHRHRLDARTHQAREDGRHLWSRDMPARATQLHGADGRPVRVHPRRAAGGRPERQHGDPRAQPLRAHTEADAARARRDRHRHGARVQGGLPTCARQIKIRPRGHLGGFRGAKIQESGKTIRTDRKKIWHTCADSFGNGHRVKTITPGGSSGAFRGSTFQKSGKAPNCWTKFGILMRIHLGMDIGQTNCRSRPQVGILVV